MSHRFGKQSKVSSQRDKTVCVAPVCLPCARMCTYEVDVPQRIENANKWDQLKQLEHMQL
jgi:hypothetical protein